MTARKFFYISLGTLALATAYHLGATRTEAQGGATFAGMTVNTAGTRTIAFAITTNGDVYARDGMPRCDGGSIAWTSNCEWTPVGNVLDGPTALAGGSWGAIKGRFK